MASPPDGDRRRDREDVVDEQRRAADHAEARAEELRGDDVAAAAGRKVLDDARVRVGDDEDGEGRADGEERRRATSSRAPSVDDLAERRVGTVGRRRQTVGAEADPGEHRDERDAVERVLGVNVLRRAEEERAYLLPHRRSGPSRRPSRFSSGHRCSRCREPTLSRHFARWLSAVDTARHAHPHDSPRRIRGSRPCGSS